MTSDTFSYRDFLTGEYKARVASNPNYSLRAFARDIGLSASRLSAVLKSHEGLSRQAAEKIF